MPLYFVIFKGPLLSTSEFILMNDLGGALDRLSDGAGHQKSWRFVIFFFFFNWFLV